MNKIPGNLWWQWHDLQYHVDGEKASPLSLIFVLWALRFSLPGLGDQPSRSTCDITGFTVSPYRHRLKNVTEALNKCVNATTKALMSRLKGAIPIQPGCRNRTKTGTEKPKNTMFLPGTKIIMERYLLFHSGAKQKKICFGFRFERTGISGFISVSMERGWSRRRFGGIKSPFVSPSPCALRQAWCTPSYSLCRFRGSVLRFPRDHRMRLDAMPTLRPCVFSYLLIYLFIKTPSFGLWHCCRRVIYITKREYLEWGRKK